MDVPYLFCNYLNRRRTSCSTRKLPDRVVVGFQLYSARTFHVTLSPRIYKGGHGPPQNIINTEGNTNNHTWRRVLRNSRPEPIKIFVFLAPSSSRAVDPYLQTLLLRVSLSRLGGKHRQLPAITISNTSVHHTRASHSKLQRNSSYISKREWSYLL